MEPNLKIKHRANTKGVMCVAPFIDGWNVWDIPEKEWTPAVQQAILHAYRLGWGKCVRETNKIQLSLPSDWPATEECNQK